MSTDYNLLQDQLIGVVLMDGKVQGFSLPEILDLLCKRKVLGFSALQHFQRHAWYAFLVQLATMALNRAGYGPDEIISSSQWAELLLDMTWGRHSPWCLVVDDLTKPAFLQPPLTEETVKIKNRKTKKEETHQLTVEEVFETFKPIPTPDAMDVLVASKNHDVKMERMQFPQPQHWIFSLVSLQTMQGYLGQGNHGISRMNGGHASRPCVTYMPSVNLGDRFVRDVELLLNDREILVEQYGFEANDGYELLWLEEWNGFKQLQLKDCDPFYIEICRRIRFVNDENDQIRAFRKITDKQRLDAKPLKGKTGDPWTPIDTKDKKAVNIGRAGFSYNRVHSLMLDDRFKPGVTQQICDDDPEELFFFACAMARGEGKTEGYHERRVPIPGHIVEMLRYDDTRQQLFQRSTVRIENASTVRNLMLKPALCKLIQIDPKEIKYGDDRVIPWLVALDKDIDQIFFERLFQDVSFLDRDEAEVQWQRTLIDLGRKQLNDAIYAFPHSMVRRYRAIAAADRKYDGAAYGLFPDVFKKREEEQPPDKETVGEQKAAEFDRQEQDDEEQQTQES